MRRLVNAFLPALVVICASGCQVYTFEPVTPTALVQTIQSDPIVAKTVKPNVMLVVDRSGSMELPTDPALPACTVGGTPCGRGGPGYVACPGSCPTRWSELQQAMAGFLTDTEGAIRLGLTFFPTASAGCNAPASPNEPLPPANEDGVAALTQQASDISLAISAIIAGTSSGPQGGTPTGRTLQNLLSYAPLQDSNRENFVLLLTDGLPNCNSSNPNNYNSDPATCQCTLSGPPECTSQPVVGCLDQTATVAAVQGLQDASVKTIVIGFGADTNTGTAAGVLNGVALAGGFPRSCPNGANSECGVGDTCNVLTRTCAQAYYQAGNATQLLDVLRAIQAIVSIGDPCVRELVTQPTDPGLLRVSINGEVFESGNDTWLYDNGFINFQGELCSRLQNATSQDPQRVEYRIVQVL